MKSLIKKQVYKRSDFLYNYSVYDEADDAAYKKTVAIVEKAFPELKKKAPLEDVDGSSVVVFEQDKKFIKVYKDYDYDEIYIKSDINLSDIDFKSVLN